MTTNLALATIIERAEGCGFADHFDPYRELVARADALNEQLASIRTGTETMRVTAVDRLARGEAVDLDELENWGAQIDRWGHNGANAMLLVGAAGRCRDDADRVGFAAARGLWPYLVEAARAVVIESVTLAPRLAKCSTDRDAMRAGPDTVMAWQRSTELYDAWVALHRLREALQAAECAEPYPPHYNDGYQSWAWFADPAALPDGYAQLPRERRLAAASAAGAGPGMYAGDTVAERRDPVLVPHRVRLGGEGEAVQPAGGPLVIDPGPPGGRGVPVSQGRAVFSSSRSSW